MADDASDQVAYTPARWYGDGRRQVQEGDLQGADLTGANLAQYSFKGVNLAGANLAGAVLAGARMERVDLTGANLAGADLRRATLLKVDLSDADLAGADLCGAEFDEVTLRGATAVGAILIGCSARSLALDDTDLSAARLDGAVVRSSQLAGVRATGAHFAGACLEQCLVTDGVFDACDLSGMRVMRGEFVRTEMKSCDLRSAAFHRTRFEEFAFADSAFAAAFLRRCEGLSSEDDSALHRAGAKLDSAEAGLFQRKAADAAAEGRGDEQVSDHGWIGGSPGLAELGEGQDASTVLASARLSRMRWHNAHLCGANLANADLRGVRLCDADLRGADLRSTEWAGVDLSRADLRGADLRGAVLEDTSLVGARLDDADLRGCSLATANLADVTLTGAKLDGARIEEGVLRGVSFEGVSAPGALTTHCDLRNTAWSECDLGGSCHTNPQLSGAVFAGCDLRGARLERANLAGFTSSNTQLDGCLLLRCHRLGAEERSRLQQGGARIEPGALARILGVFGRSRRLRLAAGLTIAVLATGTATFLLSPSLWPTPMLMTRLATLPEPSTQTRCARYIKLGEVLLDRRTDDPDRQIRLLGPMDACYAGAAQHEKRLVLLERSLELLPRGSEHASGVATALARALLEMGQYEEAEQAVLSLLEDDLPLSNRYDALILLQQLYLTRGIDKAADPRWPALVLDLGETIVAMPHPPSNDVDSLASHLAELALLGNLDLATAIAERLARQDEGEHLWPIVRHALVLMTVAAAPVSDASSFIAELQRSKTLAGYDDVMLLLTYAQLDLLLEAGDLQAAEELVASRKSASEPSSDIAERLLQARLDLELGQPKRAFEQLVVVRQAEGLSHDIAELAALLTIRSLIAQDDQPGAVDVLIAHLEGERRPDVVSRLMQQVSSLSNGLTLLMAMGERRDEIGNPIVKDLLAEGHFEMEMLRVLADSDDLAVDDPQVTAILAGADPDLVSEVVRLLFDDAQDPDAFDEVSRAVADVVRSGHKNVRRPAGMLLVEYTLHHRGDARQAAGWVEEFGLDSTADPENTGLLLEVAAYAALETGDTATVEQSLAQAYALQSPGGANTANNIAQRYTTWLQDRGRLEEALAVARGALEQLDHPETRARFREYAITSLIALGRPDEAETEIRQLAEEASACLARRVEAQTRENLGQSLEDLAPLEKACTLSDTPPEHRMDVAEFLCDRGRTEGAGALLEGLELAGPESRARWALVYSRVLDAQDRRDEALTLLDRSYGEATDAWQKEALAQGALDLLTLADDGPEIISRYRRFTSEHPGHEPINLWLRAAEQLIRLGEDEKIADLGGDASWIDRLEGSVQLTRLRDLMAVGAYDDAMAELTAQVAATQDEGRLQELGWIAVEVARATGSETQALAVLESIRGRVPEGSDAWFSLGIDAANLLGEYGRDEEAMTILGEVLAADLHPRQVVALAEVLPWLAGRCLDVAEIETQIAHMGARGLTDDQVTDARFAAAAGLVQRDLGADARRLLSKHEGETIAADAVRSRYPVILGAWNDDVQGGRIGSLLPRFPPEPGEATCLVYLTLLGQVPWDSPQAAESLEFVKSECAAGHLGVWDLQTLSEVLCSQDRADEALRLLGVHAGAVPQQDQPRLALVRARTAASAGDLATARTELERLADTGSDPHLAAEAMSILISEVYPADRTSADRVVKRADSVIAGVGPDTGEARQVRSRLVEFLRAEDRVAQAIGQQALILDSLPPDCGDEQSWELLRMAHLHVEKNGGTPSRAALQFIDEAIAVASPEGDCARELRPLKVAFEVKLAGHTRVLRERLAKLPESERPGFADAVAAALENLGAPALADEARTLGVPPGTETD